MPIPERTFTQEFFTVNPPVIPVKIARPKGRGNPGTLSHKGFEGYKLVELGDNQWSVTITPKFTVKCLSDGYAEIPDTKRNRHLLSLLSKPRMSTPTYDRGISKDLHNEGKFNFRNNDGIIKQLTDEALKKGEIRLIAKAKLEPAVITKLKSLRTFDVNDKKKKDSHLCQLVRPWLKEFVKVNEAVMAAPAI